MYSVRNIVSRSVFTKVFTKPSNIIISTKPLFCTQVRNMSEYKLKGITALSLAPGEKREVEVEGIEGAKVLLVNAAGKIQAIGPKCTHYGAPLSKGVLTKSGRITCPWHGACFSATTGDVEDAPALDAIATFKAEERDGAVYITGDEATIKSGRRQPTLKRKTVQSQDDRVVVVGGGAGAMGSVQGLRENGYTGHITMITNEGNLPLDRTKLSKALIADASKLEWRDKDWYKDASIEVVQETVTDVDLSNKTVVTKGSGKFQYSKLILATGGTPRNLPLQGFKVLDNIFALRSVKDTQAITKAIGDKGKKIVVIGSSFIGMEVAGATASDNTVTVIGMEAAPLERILGKEVGAGLQKAFEGKGVKFYLNASVDKAEPSTSDPSKVGFVTLKDGTKIEADLVILGIGVSPATEYLTGNKIVRLEEDGSLKTDETCSVIGIKDVYAIGDIASFPYHGPGGDGKYIRIEHWNVAQQSGRVVARHIVNPVLKPERFTPIFWSALGAQLRYCGNTVGGYDDLILEGKPEEANFVAYYTKGETVVALASQGRDPVMAQAAELMRRDKMPSKSQIKGGLDILAMGPPE